MTKYRSALLLGSDHPDLSTIAVETLSDDLAIGLSRGRFPKGYHHVDPNEDAVFAATNGTAAVFAVTDGHNGCDAAEAAMEGVADTAPQVLGAPSVLAVERLVAAAIGQVGAVVPYLEPPRNKSGTALTVCFVRGRDMTTATLGDSGFALATKRRVRHSLGEGRFLTPTTDPTTVPIGMVSLPTQGLVVAASDGLFDFTRDTLNAALREAPGLPAADTADRLIRLAGRGGAGDHVSVAVIFIR